MHQTTTLALLTYLLRSTTAFVSFAHSLHPEIDMSTISPASPDLAYIPTATFETIHPSPASPSLFDPSPTESQPLSTSLSSADDLSDEYDLSPSHDLKARQAAITAPPAALPSNPLQVSPVTTYEIDSYPPNGGGAVKIPIVYTQKFAEVLDQWELPGVGSIGMGGIQGKVGVVKTKRFVPFFVENEEGGEVRTASSFTA